MSAPTTASEPPLATELLVDPELHDDDHHEHPSDFMYVKIALLLAAITAAEVALPYMVGEANVTGGIIIVMLVMMVVKFFVVGSFFMHLRFDNPVFRTLFVAGLLLAVAVYVGAMAMFEFWDGSYQLG